MCNCKLKTRSKTRSLIMKKRERARYKSSLPTNWLLFNANMKPLFQTPIPFSISCSHPLPSATPVDLDFLAAGPLRGPPFAGMAMHAVYGISGRGHWRATIIRTPDNNSLTGGAPSNLHRGGYLGRYNLVSRGVCPVTGRVGARFFFSFLCTRLYTRER